MQIYVYSESTMFQIISKKTITGFVSLLIAFCSFCMSSGLNAFASDRAEGHVVMHEHHDHSHSTENETGENQHIECCDDAQEVQVVKNNEVDCFDVDCNIFHFSSVEVDNFSFDLLENHIKPNAPPDDVERRESERDSTKLLL